MPRERSRPLFLLAGIAVAAAILLLWLTRESRRDPAPERSSAAPTETRPQQRIVPAPEQPDGDESRPAESQPDKNADGRLHISFVDENGAPVVGYAAVFLEDERVIHGTP